MGYYLGGSIGNFGLVAFRGSVETGYYRHLKRLHDNNGYAVLLLGEKDLLTFIRQARNGKVKDAHIQDRYDELLRRISQSLTY